MIRNFNKGRLEKKIAKIELAISRNREKYERLTAELDALHQKAIRSEEMLDAITASSRSYEEIMNFIQEKNPEKGYPKIYRIHHSDRRTEALDYH